MLYLWKNTIQIAPNLPLFNPCKTCALGEYSDTGIFILYHSYIEELKLILSDKTHDAQKILKDYKTNKNLPSRFAGL